MNKVNIKTSDELLGEALSSELLSHVKSETIQPGIYAGWDPAEVNDRSAFTILSKDVATPDNPFPRLKCRMLRDLTLDRDGVKNVTYMSQAKNVLELDRKYNFSKLRIDTTREKFVYEYLKDFMGVRVEPVTFTRPVKVEMLHMMKVVFQEKILQLNPYHKNYSILKRELYELNVKTLKHPDRGSDDFLWALALAITSTDVVNYKKPVESGTYGDEYFIF